MHPRPGNIVEVPRYSRQGAPEYTMTQTAQGTAMHTSSAFPSASAFFVFMLTS